MNFVRAIINLFQFNRTNWKAAVLCLLAAAIFWLFNAFNKSQTTTIRFPVRFDYDRQRYVPVHVLPVQLGINVTGSGWELIRESLGLKLPELVIPIERPLETKKIPTSALESLLDAQLGSLQVNYITTDTLQVLMEERVRRTFRLVADASKIKFRKGFGISQPPAVTPDSVVIDGPKSIVYGIPKTITLTVQAANISKSFEDEMEVPLFNSETIHRNPPVVTVNVQVSEMVSLETSLRLTILHQPRKTKMFADSVKAIIQYPENQKEDFVSRLRSIHAEMDWRKTGNGTRLVYPEVVGLPGYARVISIDTLTFKID